MIPKVTLVAFVSYNGIMVRVSYGVWQVPHSLIQEAIKSLDETDALYERVKELQNKNSKFSKQKLAMLANDLCSHAFNTDIQEGLLGIPSSEGICLTDDPVEPIPISSVVALATALKTMSLPMADFIEISPDEYDDRG